MSATSLTLLDRLREKPDSDTWNRFADLYCPLLQHWALRLGVQTSDADDAVQEVLTVVLRELPDFQHTGRAGAFRAWLRQILVHRLRDFWRSRQHRPQATGDTAFLGRLEQLADDASGLSQLWNREHDEQVLKRLMESVQPRFDPKTWLAFRRQVIDQARADAVAAELGMSVSSVYVAKSRVLGTLRQQAGGLIDEF